MRSARRATRGAAISLAWISVPRRTITWIGLGNVEGRLISARSRRAGDRSLRLLAGVAGRELPRLAPATIKVRRGDVVVFASDGVEETFADALKLSGSVTEIAKRILATHWDGTDDALVIVLRWLPSMSEDGR